MSRKQSIFAPNSRRRESAQRSAPVEAPQRPASEPILPRDAKGKIIGRVGVGAVVVALLLVLMVDRASPLDVGAEVVLISLGAGLIGFGLGSRKHAAGDATASVSPGTDLQRALLMTTIPVWVRQLEAVRQEGDRAIEDLARSFEDIVAGLNNSLDESRNAVAKLGGITAQFKATDEDLTGVVQAVQVIHAAKGVVLAEIVRGGRDLREISDEVNQLALRSRLLSLNAAIEAARAGEAGRPFGVVVTEMRDLATRMSDASRHIANQLGQIEAAVQSVQQQDEARAHSEVGSINQAEAAIATVMRRFTTMTETLGQSVATMEGGGAQMRAQIADALVALQFQDRVSQILDHTTRNLEKLMRYVEAGTLDEQAIDSWQTEMAANSSTHEELASMGVAHGKRASKDVTYF